MAEAKPAEISPEAVEAVLTWKFPHGIVDQEIVSNYESLVRRHLSLALPAIRAQLLEEFGKGLTGKKAVEEAARELEVATTGRFRPNQSLMFENGARQILEAALKALRAALNGEDR